MKRSNCHFVAWKKFVEGEAEWIAFRQTDYAKCDNIAKHWSWKYTLGYLGTAIQWTGQAITFIGWLVRWIKWYHVIWILPNGERREFVPIESKKQRILPLITFKGKEQRIE